MTTYVILKRTGNFWKPEGRAFVWLAKAVAYVKDDDTLRYTRVTLDVDCG